jgi:hypothetical protein
MAAGTAILACSHPRNSSVMTRPSSDFRTYIQGLTRATRPRCRLHPVSPAARLFPFPLACASFPRMKPISWLRGLLPFLAIVGLLLGPLAAPVNGGAMAAAAAMPDDMPCCPDDGPAGPDCQKTCPLMALCAAKCFSGAPMLSALATIVLTDGYAIRPARDAFGDSLAVPPPTKPPRP